MSQPTKRAVYWLAALVLASALAACGGGGGSGSGGGGGGGIIPGGTPTPGATSTPTIAPTSTPTSTPSATPTAAPTATPATIIGTVVDAGSGNPIAGITVAVETAVAGNTAPMAGSSAPVGSLTAVTAADGTFTIVNTLAAPNQTNFYLDVYGAAAYSNNSIHGQFFPGGHFGVGGGAMSATGVSNIGTVKLTNPTAEEATTLARMNTFRASPGGFTAYANNATLVFDENLLEQAQYWANDTHTAGVVGHTCASIGSPAGCIEPNIYLQSLPGSAVGNASAQSVGGAFANWAAVETAIENEGLSCTPHYDTPNCPIGDPPAGAGHYINLMTTSKWVGLGQVESAYATYVQQLQ